MTWLSSLVIFVAYCLACLGLGLLAMRFIRRLCGAEDNHDIPVDITTKMATVFLAGAALYSAVLTVLGLLGQLHILPLILILLPGWAGLVFGHKFVLEFGRANYQSLRVWKEQSFFILVIAFMTAMLAFALGAGSWFLPPKGDAAAFYLVYPKIIAASGILEPMPGPLYYFSSIGLSIELHYAALLILADIHAAKLFMFPIAMAACVMLASIVRLCGGGIVAVTIAWAMVLSSYTFNHYIFDGKVDLAAAAFGVAALYWFLVGSSQNISMSRLALSGWLAGLAASAKFSYVLVLGASLLVLFIWRLGFRRLQHENYKQISFLFVKIGSLMAVAAIMAWAPQLLKNGVLFGNPLLPFIGGSQTSNWLNQVWFSQEVTRKILLTYPFALVFGRYQMQGGGLSFLFLAFLPFLFWLVRPVKWQNSITASVTVAALMAVLIWMLLRPSVIAPRYILASLLLFVPILALAIEAVWQDRATSPLLRLGIFASVLLAILSSFWHLLPIPSIAIAGLEGKRTQCIVASQECSALQQLNNTVQPGERVLIATYYTYWLSPKHLQCRDTHKEHKVIPQQDKLVSWLRKRGFSYAVIDPNVYKELAKDLKELAKTDKQVHHVPAQSVTLFRFGFNNASSSQIQCVETTPGRWILEKTSS